MGVVAAVDIVIRHTTIRCTTTLRRTTSTKHTTHTAHITDPGLGTVPPGDGTSAYTTGVLLARGIFQLPRRHV